jgi:hypothetical protein
MEVRQISNRKNKICLRVGIGMCIISAIEMLLIKFYFKSKWTGRNVDLFFLLLGIIGILMILIAGVNIVSNIGINKYLKNSPYGIDYQKEISTYKIIGKNKKKIKNGALEFEKYSAWKEYIEKKFEAIIDNEDAYRFMVRRLRNKESYKELITSSVIPIEIGMLTVFYSIGIDISKIGTILPILVSAIFLLIIVMVNYLDCKEEINFILDFNEIIFPSKVHLKSTSYHQAP